MDLSALAGAESAGLVTLDGGRVEFRHPLARSAIYADAPAGQRRDAHRALAAALPDRDVDRRAWHLAAAATGPDEAASAALEQAGARSRDRSAYATAAAAYERAGRLTADHERRGRLLREAAEAALARRVSPTGRSRCWTRPAWSPVTRSCWSRSPPWPGTSRPAAARSCGATRS